VVKSINPGFTQAYVKTRLKYNRKTGIWTWLEKPGTDRETRRWNARYAGTEAGYLHRGYIEICLDFITCGAHNLAWLYVYGVWPVLEVDHIDRVRHHNWIDNLRQEEHQQHNKDDTIMCVVSGREIPFAKFWGRRHHPTTTYNVAMQRFVKLGWDKVEACMVPKELGITCEIDGKEVPFYDLWKEHHHETVTLPVARTRYMRGWDAIAACDKPARSYGRRYETHVTRPLCISGTA